MVALAINEYLPRRGTNRLWSLNGVCATPQGMVALDAAFEQLYPYRLLPAPERERKRARDAHVARTREYIESLRL